MSDTFTSEATVQRKLLNSIIPLITHQKIIGAVYKQTTRVVNTTCLPLFHYSKTRSQQRDVLHPSKHHLGYQNLLFLDLLALKFSQQFLSGYWFVVFCRYLCPQSKSRHRSNMSHYVGSPLTLIFLKNLPFLSNVYHCQLRQYSLSYLLRFQRKCRPLLLLMNSEFRQ